MVHQNPINDSSYILYDTRILPTAGKKITWTNDNKDTQTISVGANEASSGNNSLKVDVKQGNATHWNVITTDFIPVAAVNLSTSFYPQIAATEKGDVYVVWVDKSSTSGDIDIGFRNSNDSGMDFNKIINLNMGNNKYYRYSLNFSAKDVNQLHSKVFYYDSNKTEIKDDFIFGGKDEFL